MTDTLRELRLANIERTLEWNLGDTPHTTEILFRGMELGGEAGELLNGLKKFIRHEMGSDGNTETPEQIMQNIRDELGDVIICADRVAAMFGIDLAREVPRKFNKTSNKVNSSVFMEIPHEH